MRVYEFSKESGIDAKTISKILGREVKVTDVIEDADMQKVKSEHAAADKKKAEKQEAKKQESEKKPAGEKSAEKTEDAPKRKKPVLLFRPENSSFGSGSGKRSNERNDRPANGKRREGQGDRNRTEHAAEPAKRTVIKPSVPTTAEMYKDNMKEEQKAVKNETASEVPVKEAAPAVTEAPVKEAPVTSAPAAAPEADVKETVSVKETAPAAEKAEKKEAPKAEETSAPAEASGKKETAAPAPKAAATTTTTPLFKKPAVNIFAELKKQEEAERQNAQERQAAKERRQNQAQGQRPFRRDGQGNGRPGQGNGRPGQGGQQGQRPYNRDQQGQRNGDRRPFNKDGQGNGRPGQGSGLSNRGVFGGQKSGGRFEKRDSAAAAPAALSKADVRGKKSSKNDKDKKGFDQNNNGNGKRAENFKNLSKGSDKFRKPVEKKEEEVIKMIVLPAVITIKELAEKMKQKPADLIKKMFLKGKMYTVNSEISYEEAEEIAVEYDILCEKEVQVDVIEELLKEEDESEDLMVKRPPVVCVMGHVDHGKTSLLDAIRETNVTAREAGGITQHIGAYMVECNGEPITFLDTPGHEAFTAMRMRGAQSTDIAVLVVAADDGVMPQTVEAINHAKAAGVDVIVAINKMDKPAANIDQVKQELTKYELIAEDWGGTTPMVPVSAKTRQGIDELLEMILLVAEVKELKANPNREMRGLVVEAKLDKGRGPVATVLVQKGTMKQGDFVSAGSFYGRVRAMLDANGRPLKAAGPSTPVEILGLNGVPNAGEVCIGHKNEKDARSYADTFIAEEKKKMLAETKAKLTMDSLFSQIQAGNIKELPIIVKADVQGSVEAVKTSLEKLSNEEVQVKVIHGAVGAINESDVSLASASNAIVIGFNVKPDAQAKQLAESEQVDLRLYRVIYQAIDDVEAAMKGMLAPVYEEKVLGHAEVRQVFKASKVGMIAGSYVLDGTFERGCQARITRDGEQIFDGNVESLKRFKDDVKEVREGFECGIVFEKFNDIQEGDIVEAYKMVQVSKE